MCIRNNMDLVYINAYTKFYQNIYICFEDIEEKLSRAITLLFINKFSSFAIPNYSSPISVSMQSLKKICQKPLKLESGEKGWWTDGRTLKQFGGYNIIPCHFFVAGYKNQKKVLWKRYLRNLDLGILNTDCGWSVDNLIKFWANFIKFWQSYWLFYSQDFKPCEQLISKCISAMALKLIFIIQTGDDDYPIIFRKSFIKFWQSYGPLHHLTLRTIYLKVLVIGPWYLVYRLGMKCSVTLSNFGQIP